MWLIWIAFEKDKKDKKKIAKEESAGEGDQSDDEASREADDKVIIIGKYLDYTRRQ